MFYNFADDDNSSLLQKEWNVVPTADGSVVTHLNVVVVAVVALLFWGGINLKRKSTLERIFTALPFHC